MLVLGREGEVGLARLGILLLMEAIHCEILPPPPRST